MCLILNIETSSDICSVALGKGEKTLDILESREERDHARVLTLLINKILKNNKLETSDLHAVAVSKGPGSYTGLRIGVSTAKGLAYGLNIPLIAVSTPEAMVAEALTTIRQEMPEIPPNAWLCPMIDARRMEVYLSFYDLSGKQQTDIRAAVITSGSFEKILKERMVFFFGTGSEKCRKVLSHHNVRFLENIRPSAESMTSLSYECFQSQAFEDVAYFEPFYLKEFIATIPKNKLKTDR